MKEYFEWLKTDKSLHDWFILGVLTFIFALIASIFIGVSLPTQGVVLQETISHNTTHSILNNPIVQSLGLFLIIALIFNNYLLCIVGIYALPWIKSKILRGSLSFILVPYQGLISGISLAPFLLKWGPIMTLAIIIPHGIFEIPALILSFSTGMAVLNQSEEKKKYIQKNTLIFSLILLILASIIEVVISPLFAKAVYQFIFV